jgi:MFS family permease
MFGSEILMPKSAMGSLIGILLLGFFGSSGHIVSPVLPQYAERLGASYIEVGLFFSAYSFTWTFLQLYTGYLSDRFGRKKFIVLGLFTYGFFLIVCGLSQNFLQLVIFRILQGVGLGLFGPAALGLVAQMKEKGKSFAFYRTASSLGFAVGPIIGGVLGNISLNYPFFVGGFLSLLAIPSVLLMYEKKRLKYEEKFGFLTSLRSMIWTRKIILVCLVAFLVELTFASLDLIIPLFGSAVGFSPATIGVVLSSYFIAFTLFQIPIGVVSEKINRKVLIIFCIVTGALPFIVFSFSTNAMAWSLAAGTLGVTIGTVFIQSSAYIAELAPEGKKSLYMAFFDSIIDYSFVIMPPIATYAYTYAPSAPFALCTVLLLIAAMIFTKA